jgi:hypothetical protein
MAVDEALREELLAMLVEHREAAVLARDDPSLLDARREVDRRHGERIWEILDDYETWPGRRLVGDDGTEAAWVIVQEAIEDPGLQHRSVELLEIAVAYGDADPVHHALLVDRVRMADGRAQLYGSQFVVGRDGGLEPWPYDDAAAVDRRRQRLGLPPLAEHAAAMQRAWRERNLGASTRATGAR